MEDKALDRYTDFSLLIDGKNAFPEILAQIDGAKESILINMFIWRDDGIGRRMAEAVLSAAERGVKVEISVDRYGVVLERSEECRRSFFHRSLSIGEKIKVAVLKLLYTTQGKPIPQAEDSFALYEAILHHPNISVEHERFKADHSKYYVFDQKTLILGGINVEDKENGEDLQGRVYQDYMVKIEGRTYVDAFLRKLATKEDASDAYAFVINRKALPRCFELESHYVDLIRRAKKDLYITMAYFSPVKSVMQEIVAAYQRGVRITVMIPECANFQNATNRKTVKRLMKATDGALQLYFSPKMVHTKLIATENEISFGSANVTKKAFVQLDELNLVVKNESCPFCDSLFEDMQRNYALSKRITTAKEIRYNRLIAFFEGFLV